MYCSFLRVWFRGWFCRRRNDGRERVLRPPLAEPGEEGEDEQREPPMVGAPGERRRVDLALRRQGKRVLAGFHERASPRIVDVGSVGSPPAALLLGGGQYPGAQALATLRLVQPERPDLQPA